MIAKADFFFTSHTLEYNTIDGTCEKVLKYILYTSLHFLHHFEKKNDSIGFWLFDFFLFYVFLFTTLKLWFFFSFTPKRLKKI